MDARHKCLPNEEGACNRIRGWELRNEDREERSENGRGRMKRKEER